MIMESVTSLKRSGPLVTKSATTSPQEEGFEKLALYGSTMMYTPRSDTPSQTRLGLDAALFRIAACHRAEQGPSAPSFSVLTTPPPTDTTISTHPTPDLSLQTPSTSTASLQPSFPCPQSLASPSPFPSSPHVQDTPPRQKIPPPVHLLIISLN